MKYQLNIVKNLFLSKYYKLILFYLVFYLLMYVILKVQYPVFNVSNFIKTNYQNYDGDSNFLEGTTEKTDKVWSKCTDLLKEELKRRKLIGIH